MIRSVQSALALSAALWLTTTAHADALTLAKICYLEATWSKPDCAAIYAVGRSIEARTGRLWLDALRRYSALDKGSNRAIEVRAYTVDGYPGASEKWRRRWAALLDLAQYIIDGKVPSPCPAAQHWAGMRITSDRDRITAMVRSGRWRVAQCREPVANTFLEVVR